jgi:flagellar basal body rod protein FlgG
MEVSLYQAAAAMNATERWQDLIAQNLTVASTPGARKQEVSFSAVAAGLMTSGQASVIPAVVATTNFKQGELRPTNGPLDFALEGKGFFTVQLPNGQNAYTRDGEFHLDAQGQLVTKQGYPVMSDSGLVAMDPNNSSKLNVSATGEISQGTDTKGKLLLTNFNRPQLLTATGDGLFLANNPALQPVPTTDTHVRQGFVEQANTSPTLEMSGLITAMRMFESNEKVLQMQSDRMSRTISELGGS